MPKFSGTNDPEAYLSWALKVDKIFRLHNYSEEKMVAMASLEFEDYALLWWENIQNIRVENEQPPIDTWEDMKSAMRTRFVPSHYSRDLFKKLQELKQGTRMVDEYFKDMETCMMRANIIESEEQTMARFLNGLNYPIKKITELLQYSNLVELVHQATKAERQVLADISYNKTKTFFASKASSSSPQVAPTNSKVPPKPPSAANKPPNASFKVPPPPSASAQASSSKITCFKCGGKGHKSFECPNTKVMVMNEDGEYESMSEGEYEVLKQVAA